jgi:hypothetical protein
MLERQRVGIVMIDEYSEGYGLRSVLEHWGYWVDVFPIGRPRHLVEILTGNDVLFPFLILSCHGVDEGIVLPQLHPDLEKEEPFLDVLTPTKLASFAQLPGRVVLSTGCSTGSGEFAQAFLGAGCAAYIAPDGSPEATAALFFVLHLFYDLSCHCSLGSAFDSAYAHDDQTGLFRLFTRSSD